MAGSCYWWCVHTTHSWAKRICPPVDIVVSEAWSILGSGGYWPTLSLDSNLDITNDAPSHLRWVLLGIYVQVLLFGCHVLSIVWRMAVGRRLFSSILEAWRNGFRMQWRTDYMLRGLPKSPEGFLQGWWLLGSSKAARPYPLGGSPKGVA